MQRDWKESTGKKKNPIKTDYSKYHFGAGEAFRYTLEGIIVVAVAGYFFYRSAVFCLLLSPLLFFYLREKRRTLCNVRRQNLNIQFKDALQSINGSLQAGYSMENAFVEAYRDMVEYHGVDSIIAKEFLVIKKGIHNNCSIEDLVDDLGNRSNLEDIRDFAGILRVGKQTGGNLYTLLLNSMEVIEEKISVKQEIQTLISAKKLESRIMNMIPFCIILYVDLTSRGYFDVLYTTIAGRILMTICLIIYAVAICLSKKIMEIEV